MSRDGKLDKVIIVAVIGASATIIGAIITLSGNGGGPPSTPSLVVPYSLLSADQWRLYRVFHQRLCGHPS